MHTYSKSTKYIEVASRGFSAFNEPAHRAHSATSQNDSGAREARAPPVPCSRYVSTPLKRSHAHAHSFKSSRNESKFFEPQPWHVLGPDIKSFINVDSKV